MREKEIWFDWATYDDDGFVNGIREDAPEEAKKSYKQYLEEKKELQKRGIKSKKQLL